jgi:hypothetical protein
MHPKNEPSVPDVIGYLSIYLALLAVSGLEMTEPVTEMSTRNSPGGNPRPVGKADSLTAISEPIF